MCAIPAQAGTDDFRPLGTVHPSYTVWCRDMLDREAGPRGVTGRREPDESEVRFRQSAPRSAGFKPTPTNLVFSAVAMPGVCLADGDRGGDRQDRPPPVILEFELPSYRIPVRPQDRQPDMAVILDGSNVTSSSCNRWV